MENQSVTPLETMRIASMGNIVTIPGFVDGETYNVRLRKPNMLTLLKAGKIPNELLGTATELFENAKKDDKKVYSPKDMADMFAMMDAFCEASLAEPTYKELKDAGVELTMEQMTFIFNYTQGGAKSLQPFREGRENRGDHEHGTDVPVQTESVA